MKWLLVLIFVFTLAGCTSGGVTPTTSRTSDAAGPTITQKLPERKLTDDTYVTLTAEVVCLSKTFPTATEAELNAKAAEIFKTYRVSETAYDAHQTEVKKDVTRSTNLSYQIVGQMEEVCGA